MIKKIRGFTILELLVVLVVMGVFTTIAYPNISSWITDREVKKEVYETVTFIKERKAEVTSGKYGMTQIVLQPNLEVYTMSPQIFLTHIKIFLQVVRIKQINSVTMHRGNQDFQETQV